jgi:1,2-diacylglycerol 3-alpha-glucosyltransferase
VNSESQQTKPPPTIVVVFARLGPYHLARLRGAADVLARSGVSLAAISIAGTDRVYAWDKVEDPTVCTTRVLFPEQAYEQISPGQLARRLRDCLDELNPLAAALPGWAFTEARIGLEWCRQHKRSAVLMSESSRGDHPRLWPREFLKQRMVRHFGSALVGGRRHRDYAKSLGIPQAAIFTGYDAVDNEHFIRGSDQARARADEVRAAHRLPARYFLTSSRFIRIKNIDGLLRAYAQYVARVTNPRDLVVCGDGECRESLHQVARDMGLEQRVHWPGFAQYPELPLYYALADAFILASTTEPWGLVVNEAMACRLPVLVSSRCGCAADLVHEGQNGFTFDPLDTESLVQAMLKLPDDPAQLAALGNQSREIIGRFGTQAFGEGLLEAARMALARKGREDFGPPGGRG